MSFRKVTSIQWAVFIALIVLGVASRFWIETPNFKPIAAFALFGGFFFRKPSMALFAVMAAMLLSDLRLGFYQWQLLVAVYLSLAFSVSLGVWIRRRLGGKLGLRQWASFCGASLLMSTAFFLLTNGAVWWMSSWYSTDVAGMAECYLMALPFYRWTLQGDLFFTFVTFGSYAAAVAGLKWQTKIRTATSYNLENALKSV